MPRPAWAVAAGAPVGSRHSELWRSLCRVIGGDLAITAMDRRAAYRGHAADPLSIPIERVCHRTGTRRQRRYQRSIRIISSPAPTRMATTAAEQVRKIAAWRMIDALREADVLSRFECDEFIQTPPTTERASDCSEARMFLW